MLTVRNICQRTRKMTQQSIVLTALIEDQAPIPHVTAAIDRGRRREEKRERVRRV